MFSLILLSQKTEKQKILIIYTIISSILAFLVGGGNFITALTSAIILGLIFVHRLIFCRSKWIVPLISLFFIGISLLISTMAPGNDYRQQLIGERMDPISAVLSSFRYAALFITTHIKAPAWFAFGCLTTVIYRAVKNSEYSFRYPGIVTAVLFGVYTSTFVPNVFSWGTYGPLRVLNINYIAFLLFLLFSIIYWCGWISRIVNKMASMSENDSGVIIQNLKTIKSAVHEVLLICFIVGCLFWLSLSLTTITSVSATRSIVNGEARVNHIEHLRRREILRDPQLSSVALRALTYQPYLLFFDDITYYPTDGRNIAMAYYYRKDSVRKTYELPLYHIGDTVVFGFEQDEFDSARRYFVYGLNDWSGNDFTWSNLEGAFFRAALEAPVNSDLQLDMIVMIYEHNEQYVGQTLKLFVDDIYVDEVFISNGGSEVFYNIIFDIPKDFVSGRNFVEIKFEFPDAYVPIDIWDDSIDEEIRAIGFKSILLTESP